MKKEEVLSRLKEIITERLDVEEDQIVPEATTQIGRASCRERV